jgi:hypothetical protein
MLVSAVKVKLNEAIQIDLSNNMLIIMRKVNEKW